MTIGGDRAVDRLKGGFREHAVVAQSLHIEEPAIGRKADGTQSWQVAKAPADAEVVAVVDGGLGAQRPVFPCGTA